MVVVLKKHEVKKKSVAMKLFMSKRKINSCICKIHKGQIWCRANI